MGSRGQREWVVGETAYMGTSGNRDYQLSPRSVSKDFTDDALTISTGSLFRNASAESLLATYDGLLILAK